MNEQAAICSTDRNGGSCFDLIYTLESCQNPVTTLSNLLPARHGTAAPISETSRRAYFSLNSLLQLQGLVERGPKLTLRRQ